MAQPLQNQLRGLLSTTHPTLPATQQPAGGQHQGSAHLPIFVVARTVVQFVPDHWAIAVILDEHSKRARVYHVCDVHVVGPRGAVAWRAFAQDEVIDQPSGYVGGVRIGYVDRNDLGRLQQAICGTQLPPPAAERWECRDWTVAVIRLLEACRFLLASATYGLNDGNLFNYLTMDFARARGKTAQHGGVPAFVPLSLPGNRR